MSGSYSTPGGPTSSDEFLASPEGPLDDAVLTDFESGTDQLLSIGLSNGLSDPFSSAQGGWIVGSQAVDPFTNAAIVFDIFNAYVGENADSYTGVASVGDNPNAFTGGQNVDALTGLQNAASFTGAGATAGPSPMLDFSIGTIEVNGSADVQEWQGTFYDNNGNAYNVFLDSGGAAILVPFDENKPAPVIFPELLITVPADDLVREPGTGAARSAQPVPTPQPTDAPPIPSTASPNPPPSDTPTPPSSPPPDQPQIQQPSQTTAPTNNPPGESPVVPFNPMADSPIAAYFLYGKGDTWFRDFITNDANLALLQNSALGIALGAGAAATGGLLIGAGSAGVFGLGAGAGSATLGVSGTSTATLGAALAPAAVAVIANPGTQQELQELESGLAAEVPALENGLGDELEESLVSSIEDKAAALQDRIKAAVDLLRRNPDLIRKLGGSPPGAPMSDRQLQAAIKLLVEKGKPNFARMVAGNALQAVVEATNYEAESFPDVAQPFERAIDFSDRSGLTAELTSEAGVDSHAAREYMQQPGAMIFSYTPLDEFEEYLRALFGK